jgi:hypothetical protein
MVNRLAEKAGKPDSETEQRIKAYQKLMKP